jgi:hypothetical protein
MNAIAKSGHKISSHRRDVICAIFKGVEHSLRLFLFDKSTILRHFASLRRWGLVLNVLITPLPIFE